MGGLAKFEDTLAARLNLMQPSRDILDTYLSTHPPRLSKGIFGDALQCSMQSSNFTHNAQILFSLATCGLERGAEKYSDAAGIPELVKKLQIVGKNVFLVSGGFRQIINPIASLLNIPLSNVFANTLLFSVSL